MRFLGCVDKMSVFLYQAYNESGAKVSGEIEAVTAESAKKLLDEQGLMVCWVKEEKSNLGGSNVFVRKSITAEELEYLTTELSLLLNSGVTIDRGLGIIRRNATSNAQAKLVSSLHKAIRKGDSLSSAMKIHEEVFSPLYINLITLGEATGTLPAVFSRLAEDIKFQAALKEKIIQALTYPAVILFVCILCLVFIFNEIVPQLSSLFLGLPEIPTYTAVLLAISDWFISYQWLALAMILIFIVALVAFAKSSSGAKRIDSIVVRVPILNGVLTLVESIRFNTAIAMMLQSGVLIDRCLEMAVGSVKNQTFRQNLIVARDRVKKGETLTAALRVSPLYNDFAISLIEVGEESGDLRPVFSEISARSRREFESWVNRVTSLLEPILILTMGAIVGGVVVVMLLSIVSVNNIGM
jgi:type II secretory pathway component PulF